MTKKEKIIIGQMRCVITDKRSRVLIADQLTFMEEKMKEIKKLVKKLPYIECKKHKKCKNRRLEERGSFWS